MIIYLAHVIFAGGFRSILVRIGIFGGVPHLVGGLLVGVGGPLLLVPVGLKLQAYYPELFGALLPVRVTRKQT